jgi:phage baseplate assembly protein V
MMGILQQLKNALANLTGRATVLLVDDRPKLQELQIELLEGERRDRCEHFQPYGLTAVPVVGAEAVVLFPGGDRAHALVVSVADRRYRKTGLVAGEVALHNHEGTYVLLKVGGVVEVNQAIDLVNGAVLRVDGEQVVGQRGGAVADSAANVASVSAQLNLLLARIRAHGLIES